ncbi:MAG: ABC transporter permease subunit [Tissierellaceae bacterium]|nr:ABC transporter permease subunit [Tissierellaceae bacterium]
MKGYTSKGKWHVTISIALTICIYMILSWVVGDEIILPTVRSIIENIVDIGKGPSFLRILGSSLYRSLWGFTISFLLAIVLAIISGVYGPIYYLISPTIKFLNSVPIIAIILLALIWLNSEMVPMFVGFVMVFPILFETVLKSIVNIDSNLMEMARVYKVKNFYIIKDIYMPSIYMGLMNILPSSIGLNLKMVISGEVLSQPKYAIGSNLQLQKMYLNTSGVFAWIVIILILGKVLEYLMRGLMRWIKLEK